jgi:manganese/zinc/iron transport system permease protein
MIGPFLVLKKMTMFANALSHTSLLGIALSFILLSGIGVFKTPLFILAALLTALVTGGFTETLKKVFKVHDEASTGLVFTFLFALGVICVTVFLKNAHLGIEAIMGNIDAIHESDITLSALLAFINGGLLVLFFPYYKIYAFDEILARSQSCFPSFFSKLLILQTAFTTISAFRAVGVFLFLIFLTAPVLAAKLMSYRLKHIIFLSAAFSVCSALIGVALSRHFLTQYGIALSTGALSATCVALCYPLIYCCHSIKNYLIHHQLKKPPSSL